MPCESSTVMSETPAASRMFAHAMPAAPTPEITTRSEAMSRSSTLVAPSIAASTTIAVPCWSSCITGQSSASMRRRSISKQRGAEMSSRLTAPNVGRSRTRVSTISSGSLVSNTIGIESRSPNALNSAALALHHRQRRRRADVAEAEHRAAVADDGHQPVRPGVAGGQRVIGGDRPTDLRYAGRVGDRQGALGVQRGLQLHGELAGYVSLEDLLVGDDDLRVSGFSDTALRLLAYF